MRLRRGAWESGSSVGSVLALGSCGLCESNNKGRSNKTSAHNTHTHATHKHTHKIHRKGHKRCLAHTTRHTHLHTHITHTPSNLFQRQNQQSISFFHGVHTAPCQSSSQIQADNRPKRCGILCLRVWPLPQCVWLWRRGKTLRSSVLSTAPSTPSIPRVTVTWSRRRARLPRPRRRPCSCPPPCCGQCFTR